MTDFIIARKNMISNQLKVYNIIENNLLSAIESIPREIFLPSRLQTKAYLDEDIEISKDRYLIEPRIFAHILKLSKIQTTDNVLDIACASGYTSSVLSKLANQVIGIDNNKDLLDIAENNVKNLDIINVQFLFSNPKNFSKKNIKFDLIFIFGGVEFIPKNILELLKDDGGRLITVLYKNTEKLGKIYLIKKIKKKITSRFYMVSHTPILSDFRKNKKEFIF